MPLKRKFGQSEKETKGTKETKAKVKKAKKVTAPNVPDVSQRFNGPITGADYEFCAKFLDKSVKVDDQFMLKELDQVSVADIHYESLSNLKGLNFIFDMYSASLHCEAWLKEKLRAIGWISNATGFEPIPNSLTTRDILERTIVCYKLALKQRLQIKI